MSMSIVSWIAGMMGGALINALVSPPPLRRAFEYATNFGWRNNIPTIEAAIELRRRGIIDEEKYRDIARNYGYEDDWSEKLYEATARLLNASEVITLYRRGLIGPDGFYKYMSKLGYDKETANDLLKATEYYPSPSDLIRFAVREVYTPEIVELYGMDEDLPKKFLEEAKKVGLPPEIAKLYWRAHWELPSATMGFEMLHRLNPKVMEVIGEKYKAMGLEPEKIVTDLDTLRTLLRTLDVMPYWRDRILAISYEPLTRVDLRRIYALGLIDDEELKARLMELGYTERDAELMLEFYKAYRMSPEKDLTRSMIEKGYRYGELSREEAVKYLMKLGYDEYEANFIITLVDLRKKEEERDDMVKALVEQFKAGLISKEKLITELDRLDVKASYRDYIVAKAERERKAKTRLPSKEDIMRWRRRRFITEEQFKDLMKAIGYKDEHIELYLKEVG